MLSDEELDAMDACEDLIGYEHLIAQAREANALRAEVGRLREILAGLQYFPRPSGWGAIQKPMEPS